MSNNTHVKKVSDHIKEQNANQQAKQPVAPEPAKQPVDAAKAPVATESATNTSKPKEEAPVNAKQAKIDTIIATNRKSDEDWKFILDYKKKEGLKSDNDLAEVFKVTVSNIHQNRAKFKRDKVKVEEAKLSTNSLVEDAKKLLAGIDEELKAFDADIEAAKSKVANAAKERAKIEAKTEKFNLIIEAFSEETKEEVTEEKK